MFAMRATTAIEDDDDDDDDDAASGIYLPQHAIAQYSPNARRVEGLGSGVASCECRGFALVRCTANVNPVQRD